MSTPGSPAYWAIFYRPKCDAAGWHIVEKDSRDGSEKRHDYPSQQAANEGYADLVTALLGRKN